LLGEALGNTKPAWTAKGPPLPGGGEFNIDALLDDVRASRPWLSEVIGLATGAQLRHTHTRFAWRG
jgi:glycerol-3-phosphate dehydrogenase